MSTKATLYDLTREGVEILDILEDALGELSPELEARLDKLMVEGPERLEAAAMVVATLKQNATACEEESERLRQRAKSFDDQAERLKIRMTACLDAAFGGKVKTSLFTLNTQKSPDHTIVELVPGTTVEMLQQERPDLVRVKMELDRVKVGQMYKNPETRKQLPELLLFEVKKGTRYVRIS
jgi:hypothetical protein